MSGSGRKVLETNIQLGATPDTSVPAAVAYFYSPLRAATATDPASGGVEIETLWIAVDPDAPNELTVVEISEGEPWYGQLVAELYADCGIEP